MNKAFLAALVVTVALLGCNDEEKFEASNQTDTSGPVARSGAPWEVWSVTNAWSDKDTPAAKKAGIAWAENSGLTWEEKFDAWVGGMETMPAASGWGTTISIKTPFGDKKLPAPTLECAEVAIFLRVTFASWYHLPFYLRGWDAETKQSVFAGHFGFVDAAGNGLPKFQRFKEKGLLNPEAGMYYRRKVLARGGVMDEMEMIKDYLGRDPKLDAYLEHLGLKG